MKRFLVCFISLACIGFVTQISYGVDDVKILKGHSDAIKAITFNHDGNILASGSFDSTIILWDTKTGDEIKKLSGHRNRVYSISFSPDDKMLASGSHDSTIILWDVTTGDKIKTLSGHSAPVSSVAFSPDGQILASGSIDKTVILWDVVTGDKIKTLGEHSGIVESIAFSPDGKMLAVGSDTITVWDVVTGNKKYTFKDHSKSIASLVFSPDGRILASGSWDNTIILWDTITFKKIKKLGSHSAPVSSVAFSPDGKMLASGGFDNTVIFWNVKTGNKTKTLKDHSNYILSVAFSPDGKIFASGSRDKTIIVQNWQSVIGQEEKQSKTYKMAKGYEKFAALVNGSSARPIDSSIIDAIVNNKLTADYFVIMSVDAFGQIDLEYWPESYKYEEKGGFSFYSWFPAKESGDFSESYRAMPAFYLSNVKILKRRYQQVLGKIVEIKKVKQVTVMPNSVLEKFKDKRGYKQMEDFLNQTIEMPIFKVVAACGFNGIDRARGSSPDKALMDLVCTYDSKEISKIMK